MVEQRKQTVDPWSPRWLPLVLGAVKSRDGVQC